MCISSMTKYSLVAGYIEKQEKKMKWKLEMENENRNGNKYAPVVDAVSSSWSHKWCAFNHYACILWLYIGLPL